MINKEASGVNIKENCKKIIFIFLLVILQISFINFSFAADMIVSDSQNININLDNSDNANDIDTNTKKEISNQEKLENVKKIVNEKNNKEEKALKDTSEDPINMYGIKMLKSLGIVIGALLIVLAIVKRTVGIKDISSKEEKILILERKNLTPKAQLVLARVDSQKVLIGVSNDSINMMPLKDVKDNKNFDDYLNFQIENGYSVSNQINIEEKNEPKKDHNKEGKKKR